MVQTLLAELHSRGIKLRLADSRLEVLAPPGSLTPPLREQLRLRRDELIALLQRTELGEELSEIIPQPLERYEPFPLTDIQHAYWVGRNPAVELGGVSTHFYLELENTDLHLRRLNRSLCQVIDRHDMLRAIVQPDGRQQILAEVPEYKIPVVDLSRLAAEQQDAEITKIRKEMAHQVLPANRWPLFDVRISQLDERRLHLHISFDMLIADGFSIYMVFHEWRRFYEEPDWAPEPLLLSYRDHIMAEESSRQGSQYKRAEEYWLSRLDELPLPPELPLVINPALLPNSEFVRRSVRVPAERWTAIKHAAQRRGLTPSAVLMTAYADVLRLWSGQPALTINLTLFNRPPSHPQIQQIIGDFTSVTLLAAQPLPSESFTIRASRLSRQLLQDLDHQSYSGVRVLRERARRLGSRPGAVMPVVFTSLLGIASDQDQADDVAFFGTVVHGISQTPQVWLDHQVVEQRDDLILNWDARDALFPDGLLDDMFWVYHQLINWLSHDEDIWDQRDLFLPLPRWQVEERNYANDTAAAIPVHTLCRLVEEQVSLCPDNVAVIAHDGQLSYQAVVEQGRRLARRLIALGATANTLVGVVLDKGCEQVTAVLGVTLSGAAYLPIHPNWPEARRRYLLEQCRTTTVITTPRLRDQLVWPDGVHVVTVVDTEVQEADAGPLDTTPASEDLAYVIFTSGSTGTPKGVMIDHRGAANTIQDINARFQVGPADRILALSELSFDLSVYDIFGTLAVGGTVIMPDPARGHDPGHWADLVRRHGVTIWNSVPTLIQAWVDHSQHAGTQIDSTLRLVLLSGDWIPVTLPDAVRALAPGSQVISLGGATEASIWSVVYPVGDVPPNWVRIPYGKPLADQTLHVYDDELQPCPVWTTGEIFIGGVGVAKGYWADPDQTKERFIIHPKTGERLYRTGDNGRYLPGGNIEFLGRRDSQIKLNGFRIELDEIVAALRRQPGVGDAIVTVVTHPVTDRRQLAAYIVAEGSAPVDPAALRGGLDDLLPDYMVPHHYLPIDRIPTSANGKVLSSGLPSPWDNPPSDERIGPRNPIERTLFTIWCDALERDDFGIEENFFELGGDSLHAVRILSRIRGELGVQDDGEAGLRRLFDNPTVASLATSLRDCVKS